MADKPLQSLTIQGLGDTYVNTPLSTAPTFNTTTAYAVGDYVFYNRKLYKFISNHSAGNWDSSQVQEVIIGNEIKQIENDLSDKYEKPATGIPASDLESGVIPDISGKADKVQNATNGNFASLDSNGNLIDSGHKHSDYLTQHQDVSGKADKVQNATNGNFAGLDSNGNLTDSGHSFTEINQELTSVKGSLNNKLTVPQTAGTSGQVLTSDGNGGQSWEDPTGGVTDVQIDGTSVVADGVANVPKANASTLGVVIADPDYGIGPYGSMGRIQVVTATDSQIKNGTVNAKAITPVNQHASTFYGLAKAAGDTTQSSSSNAVGTYTETAQSKIHEMLDAPVTVSGTTPTITGKAGIRYICGEVSTLSITAPESGCIDVVFTSGSTPTVLTVTSAKTGVTAIKWMNGFDPTALDANTTYEINILDGELGVAGSWT